MPVYIPTDSSNRAFTHDPEVYHDPTTFRPERFLSVEGQEPEADPYHFVLDSGVVFALPGSWPTTPCFLSAARFLSVFYIGKKPMEDGTEA